MKYQFLAWFLTIKISVPQSIFKTRIKNVWHTCTLQRSLFENANTFILFASIFLSLKIPLPPLVSRGNLLFSAPPESPEGLQLLQVTSRQITFSWTAPSSGNSPITGYIVVYNQSRSKYFLILCNRSYVMILNMTCSRCPRVH